METSHPSIINGLLTREEILSELAHVRNLLAESEAKVRVLWEGIDKLTAAQLRIGLMLKKLEEGR